MTQRRRQNRNMDFEIQFYEGILKNAPDFIEALVAIGDLYTRKGWHQKGLDVDRRLSSLRPDDPFILYNLACSYSLNNDIPRSFATIKSAIRLGYDHIDYLEQDPDLTNLRRDHKFQAFLTRIKRKKATQLK